MKYLPIVAGILLGIMFAGAGIVVLLNLAPAEAMPEGRPRRTSWPPLSPPAT